MDVIISNLLFMILVSALLTCVFVSADMAIKCRASNRKLFSLGYCVVSIISASGIVWAVLK